MWGLYLKKPIFPFLWNKFYIVMFFFFFHLVDPLFIWHYNRSKNSTLLLVFADLRGWLQQTIFFLFLCAFYIFSIRHKHTHTGQFPYINSNRYLLHILCRKKRCSYQYCSQFWEREKRREKKKIKQRMMAAINGIRSLNKWHRLDSWWKTWSFVHKF